MNSHICQARPCPYAVPRSWDEQEVIPVATSKHHGQEPSDD